MVQGLGLGFGFRMVSGLGSLLGFKVKVQGYSLGSGFMVMA